MILIYATFPSREKAAEVSEALIRKSLAACVNMLPVESFYHWEKELKKGNEFAALIKTEAKNFRKIEETIFQSGGNDTPCILEMPVARATEKYLRWVRETLGPSKTVIGGTFDLFHLGHKALLNKALETGDVSIGLTSDNMAKKIKDEKVTSFDERKDVLLREAEANVTIREINDEFGFAVDEDFDYIIVSPETYNNAALINKKRREVGKEPLVIIRIDFVLAQDGKPISSTRIRNNEIDRNGKLIS